MRKEYFSIDPQFPDRLLKAGRTLIIEFIQDLFRDFSQRHLTNATDRVVAFSGLESRISKAIHSKSIYGIPERFIHQSLLWQRPEHGQLDGIKYIDKSVPSWSWMACSGPIEFAMASSMERRKGLSFEGNQKNALSAAEVADFMNCELKGEEKTKVLERGTENIIGRIQYDKIDDIPELSLQRCIVVGREIEARHKSYVLVVSPTFKHEYTRIGIGEIDSSYLSRIEGKVRII